jgi:RNA polymerase sigma-70 factor (ECF subfamily)
VSSIARQYGLMENHVAVILSRTRKKLKVKLAKEGYL